MQAVLAAPLGVVHLMDMLGDKEALRNEALLLFMGLSRSNQSIQQIAAFEGAFERLLNIIRCADALKQARSHYLHHMTLCMSHGSCIFSAHEVKQGSASDHGL